MDIIGNLRKLFGRSSDRAKQQRIILQRSYHGAQGGRLTANWISSNSSGDAELIGSLTKLRGRSRQLVRDASYAKRAKVIVVNNVIGSGIGMQAQVRNRNEPKRLLSEINSEIEEVWSEWSRPSYCHMGGKLHFSDIERVAMGQIFEAGEVIIRKHRIQIPGSPVALALELIEPERLADHYSVSTPINGNEIRMGVEQDSYGRPQAYWLHRIHPGEVAIGVQQTDMLVRVPADQIMHLYPISRWPQSRGEPWMHAAARRLNDMEGYSEAEIVAARGAASYMAFIKTPDATSLAADVEEDGQRQISMEPGIVEQLPPGWDIEMNNPNRPNPNMDPFMRLMLREIAAGVGVSYESLSRDYSQSNYSSSRLALLDDRDLWKVLQSWFIRTFREELYREWLEIAVLSGALRKIPLDAYLADPKRFSAVQFKPRGWSWVDPTKEVQAYKDAVRCGFTTVSDVISQTANGKDLEDVLQERRRELDMMEEMDLEFDTDPESDEPDAPEPEATAPATASPPVEPNDDDEIEAARVVPIRSNSL
jgi:lambda family phage portal protein